MLIRRLYLTGFLAIWIAFVCFLPGAVTGFGHTYGHWTSFLNRNGHSLPIPPIAEYISYPILSGNSALFYMYFGVLFLVPSVLVIGIWYIRDRIALLEWFCYGFCTYMGFFISSIIVISFGLWSPFALL